jgi:hypothetical protein
MDDQKHLVDNKRFEPGVNILARLQNEIWSVEAPDRFAVLPEDVNLESGELHRVSPELRRIPLSPASRPSLQSILADLPPLSCYSILIGSCDDGLPVLVDLSSSQAGSLLILGGPGSGKTTLLLSILASACRINSARKIRTTCISARLPDFGPILAEPHCYRFSDPYEGLAAGLVRELADLACQRTMGKDLGPAILLAIDDLGELLGNLDEEDAQRLYWLIKEGPASQVWTLATLDASRANAHGPNLIDFFGTCLVGRIEIEQQSFLPTQIQEARPEQLLPGAQFCARFENEWVRFWVPRL